MTERRTGQPAGVSIGRFLRFDRNAAMNADFVAAIAAIDRVHGVDEDLPEIPLINAGAASDAEHGQADAWFGFDSQVDDVVLPTLLAVRIGVPFRRVKTLHEIGHLLDTMGLPVPGFSSLGAAELDGWRVAVGESHAFRQLLTLGRTTTGEVQRRVQDALRLEEIWARSYAQFVAIRSGDQTLRAETDALRSGRLGGVDYPLQWTERDFSRIEAATTALFKELGWMA